MVTGGAGFIGSHLCEKLIKGEHSVICLDNFNDYYDPAVKRRNIKLIESSPLYNLVECDILDLDAIQQLFKSSKIEVVIHLAARAGVRPSIEDPLLYQKVNVEGTTNLLEVSVKSDVAKFIMASSSSVYGKNKKIPFSEADPVDNPISPYAATKKACELIGHAFHSLYKLPVSCLRFFTVYGPRQRPDMAIHKFTKCINEGKEISMFGDGRSKRDYTYITDIIHGIEQSVKHCHSYHIYNLGESKTIELRSLIKLLEDTLGKRANILELPNQPGDVPVTYADITKAGMELGYNPHVSIEEGIKKFVDWFQALSPEETAANG